MNVNALDSTTTVTHAARAVQAGRDARLPRGDGDFAAQLAGRMGGAAPARDAVSDKVRAQVREASQQLVASTLLLPLLKQMREDPLRVDLFHGGSTEDIFAAQLDTELADRMVQGMNLPIVDAVYERIMRQVEARAAARPSGAERIDRHG
jgi:hypothetical protein